MITNDIIILQYRVIDIHLVYAIPKMYYFIDK